MRHELSGHHFINMFNALCFITVLEFRVQFDWGVTSGVWFMIEIDLGLSNCLAKVTKASVNAITPKRQPFTWIDGDIFSIVPEVRNWIEVRTVILWGKTQMATYGVTRRLRVNKLFSRLRNSWRKNVYRVQTTIRCGAFVPDCCINLRTILCLKYFDVHVKNGVKNGCA